MNMNLLTLIVITLTTLFCGCVGPITYRTAKLPDGSEVRVYSAASLAAPSVSFVAVKAAASTNWTLPNVFSGPGLIPGASTGGGIAAAGALIRPDHSSVSAVNRNESESVKNNIKPPKVSSMKMHHNAD